jgi:hypothetical protein
MLMPIVLDQENPTIEGKKSEERALDKWSESPMKSSSDGVYISRNNVGLA